MISKFFPPMKPPLQKHHHDIYDDLHEECQATHENPFLQKNFILKKKKEGKIKISEVKYQFFIK